VVIPCSVIPRQTPVHRHWLLAGRETPDKWRLKVGGDLAARRRGRGRRDGLRSTACNGPVAWQLPRGGLRGCKWIHL